MSWDKNTINLSNIDSIIYTLESLKHPYTLIEIGKVVGMGCNDNMYQFDAKNKYYILRKLRYHDKIFLERMHRTNDCDSDDIIISHEFTQDNLPKEWHLEVFEDYQSFVDINGQPSNYYGEEIYIND